MPLDERDYIRGQHAPTCTCVECTNKRLRRLRKEAHPSYVSICPRCGKKSLWYNGKDKVYECLNLECRVVGDSLDGIARTSRKGQPGELLYSPKKKEYSRKEPPKSKGGCLLPILLIFALFLISFGIYQWIGTSPTSTPTTESVQPNLRNPTWNELKTFLWTDETNQLKYVYPTFVCEDFARTLQSNAKKAGWRCALVNVRLEGYPDWFHYGIPSNTWHGLNAFETTDRGLVYIDCTGLPTGSYNPGNCDKIVNVKVGSQYAPLSIFPTPGWGDWESCGTVVDIETLQW